MFWKKTAVIAGGPVLIMLMLVAGHLHDLFQTTLWHDALMHLLGGGFLVTTLTGTIWHLRWKTDPDSTPPRPVLFKAGLLAVLFITVVIWEIIEVRFSMTPNWTHSRFDTFTDMAWALTGAIIALRFIRLK